MTFCIQYSYLLVVTLLLVGCTDGRNRQEVKAFCQGIKPGEMFQKIDARQSRYHLQPGGFAQDPRQRFAKAPIPQHLDQISGALFEPQGRIEAQRPVCAVYFSNPLLGGDDKVILAEYLPNWDKRN
jgi:hypothetical protein